MTCIRSRCLHNVVLCLKLQQNINLYIRMMMSLESPPQTTLTGGQRPQKKGGLNADNHLRETSSSAWPISDSGTGDGRRYWTHTKNRSVEQFTTVTPKKYTFLDKKKKQVECCQIENSNISMCHYRQSRGFTTFFKSSWIGCLHDCDADGVAMFLKQQPFHLRTLLMIYIIFFYVFSCCQRFSI